MKSEVGLKVAAALRESGIETARPEMYLKNIDASENREILTPRAPLPHTSNSMDHERQDKENTQDK